MSIRSTGQVAPDVAISDADILEKEAVLELPEKETLKTTEVKKDFEEKVSRETKLISNTIKHLQEALEEIRQASQTPGAMEHAQEKITAAGLKQNIQEIAQSVTGMLSVQEISLQGAKGLVEELSNINIQGEQDVKKTTQIIDKVRPLLKTVAESMVKIKQQQELYERLKEQYESAVIKEAGFETHDDLHNALQNLRDKKSESRKKIYQLSRWYKGFGYINKKDIDELKAEKEQLQKQIAPLEEAGKASSYSSGLASLPYGNEWTTSTELRTAEQALARKTTSEIVKLYEELLKEVSTDKEEEKSALTDSQIESLNVDFLDKYFQKRVDQKTKVLQKQDRSIDGLTNPDDINRATALLKRAFASRINTPWMGEPEEDLVQAQQLQQEAEQFPNELKDIITGLFSRNKRAANELYNDMVDFAANLDANKQRGVVERSFRSILQQLEILVAQTEAFDYSNRWEFTERRRQLEQSTPQKQLDEFLENLDTERWGVFISNQEMQSLIGSEQLKEADRYLAYAVKDKVLDQRQRSDEAIKYGDALMQFHYADHIPTAIISAHRDAGYSGEVRKNQLARYITEFSEQELSQLEQQNIPGLAQIIKLIKENPETFYQAYLRSEKWEVNPIYGQVQQNLVDMAAHNLESSEPRVQTFASGVFRGIAVDVGTDWKQCDLAIDKLFNQPGDNTAKAEILEFLQIRAKAKDETAIDILLRNSKNIGIADFDKIAKNLVGPLALLDNRNPDHVELLATQLQLSQEDLEKTLNFIKGVRAISISIYEPEKFEDYVSLASNSEILPLVQELHQYGYRFDIEHAQALSNVEADKKDILESIEKIKEIFPDFKYHLDSYYTYNEGQSRTQYRYQPRDILARQDFPYLEETDDPEKAKELKSLFFEAYREFNPEKIISQILYFSDEFKVLPIEERNEIIDLYIGLYPAGLIDTLSIIDLNEQQKDNLVKGLVGQKKYESLVGLWDEKLAFDRGIMLREILNGKPEIVLKQGQALKISSQEYSEELAIQMENFLNDLSPSKFNEYHQIFSQIVPQGSNTPDSPWGTMYRRLVKLQSRSEREEYDPWKTDLDPLVQTALAEGVLDRENIKDSEILYGYVHEYGMYNLPTILKWHSAIARAREITDIAEDTRREINDSLGIDLDRLPNKGFITVEIKKFRDRIQADLVADKTPPEIVNTQAGLELFLSLKGSTSWKRSDNPQNIIKLWMETVEKQPELSELPEDYKEVEFEVPIAKRKELDAEEQRDLIKEQNKVLENPELNAALTKLDGTYRKAFELQHLTPWWEQTKAQVLSKIETQIQALDIKISEAKNDRAKEEMEKQKAKLNEKKSELATLTAPDISFADLNSEDEARVVSFIEELNRTLPAKLSGREDILRTLSASHALRVMNEGQKDLVNGEIASHTPDSGWAKDDVFNWRAHLYDYLAEHYLNSNQRQSHIGHTPFSGELLKDLQILWGTKSIKKNIILQKENELRSLEDDSLEATTETMKINLVPARGVLRIYSGDVGDACYTSQHQQLASGQYPKLTSFSFVTGRGEKNEKLAGSVLAIETTNPAGERVLLVRANNPQENLIQKVDSNVLIAKTLEEMKDLAKRRNIEHVVVPRDQATASSSNRRQVAGFYSSNFGKNEPMELTNEPETNFNGYPNWDSTGHNKVVKIN